jgi:WD40 repeat protein
VEVADAGHDAVLLVAWDLTTKTRRFPDVGLSVFPGAMAISPDGRLVAVGGGTPGRVEVRSIQDGSLVRSILNLPAPRGSQLSGGTSAVTFLPDGTLAVGSQQGAIRIFDPITGTELRRLEGPREMSEAQLLVAPDGRSLYGAGAEGDMAWDLTTGQTLWPNPAPPCPAWDMIAARLDALLCFDGEGHVGAHSLATGTPVPVQFGYQQGAFEADLTPDGARLIELIAAGLAVWRLDGGGPASRSLPNTTGYSSVEFDGLGHLLANRREGTTNLGAALLDPTTGRVVDSLDGVLAAFTTPRAGRLFAWFDDGTGGFYDVAEHRRVPGYSVPLPFEYRYTTKSGNLLILVIGKDGRVLGVDLTTGQLTQPSVDDESVVFGAIATPDGRRLLTDDSVNRGAIRNLDWTLTGESLPDGMKAPVTFGADLMVTGSEDGSIRVFDPSTLQPMGPNLRVTSAPPVALLLSDDGRRLIVVGADRTIQLADMAERSFVGAPIDMGQAAAYRGEETGITAPALSPDGQFMVYANRHGLMVWDLDPDHLIAGACQVASRNLTRAEWEENISDLAPYTQLCPDQPSA